MSAAGRHRLVSLAFSLSVLAVACALGSCDDKAMAPDSPGVARFTSEARLPLGVTMWRSGPNTVSMRFWNRDSKHSRLFELDEKTHALKEVGDGQLIEQMDAKLRPQGLREVRPERRSIDNGVLTVREHYDTQRILGTVRVGGLHVVRVHTDWDQRACIVFATEEPPTEIAGNSNPMVGRFNFPSYAFPHDTRLRVIVASFTEDGQSAQQATYELRGSKYIFSKEGSQDGMYPMHAFKHKDVH